MNKNRNRHGHMEQTDKLSEGREGGRRKEHEGIAEEHICIPHRQTTVWGQPEGRGHWGLDGGRRGRGRWGHL